ncbi:MAG: M16 family metallopeptidase [Acidobacteriota bacterium]
MKSRKLPIGTACLIALLMLASVGFAADDSIQCPSPFVQPPYVQRTLNSKPGDTFVVLKNGLTVLIRQQAEAPAVSAQVFVRAGSIYEDKYLTSGISHYLEHVLSSGSTKSFTEKEAKERLERMGGNTNAYTTYDRTVYYINTASEHWQGALDLLLSYMTENTLDPQEVAREKSVIQQEIKMGENNPDGELYKLYLQTAYQKHPLRNPVIGYEEVFVHLDRQALLDYYTERYQPDNMVVVVAGNVNPTEVLDFVNTKTKSFIRKNNQPPFVPAEPMQSSPRWDERTLPIARLTQATVGFPSVSLHDDDLYALDVLSLLLGEGRTCRLFCRLKDQEGKVLSIGASNWTPSYTRGQFMISMSMSPQYWPEVLKSVEGEIDYFKNNPVGSEELEKAKKMVIAQHVFGKETMSAQASSLASSFFDTGDPYFDEAYVKGVRNVTPEQIQRASRRYLDMERMSVAVTKPPATVQTASASSEAPAAAAVCKPSQVDMHQFDNGLKVLLKQDGSLPLVTIHLYGLGGLLLEDKDKPGISAFTAGLVTEGTKTRDKIQIHKAFEDVGGQIGSTSDNNTYHVVVKVLKEDLDMALDILSDVVQNASFPQEEIDKRRTDTLLALQKKDESWQAEVVRLFKSNYFSRSPYRNDRLGSIESVKAFTRDDLLATYRRMVNPTHSAMAIYGDVDPEKVMGKIQERFKGWSGNKVEVPTLDDETRTLTADKFVEKKNEKSSSALLIGTNGLSLDSKDRPVLDVLSAVLSGSGYPGGRLFEGLRGSEDLVYIVSGFPFYGKQAGFYGVISQTTFANLDKVQDIILANLRKVANEPVPTEELEKAKEMIVTTQKLGMESLDSQAQTAVVNEVMGFGWDFDKRYPDMVRAVKPEDVQRVAKDLFSHMLIARTVPENPVEIMPASAAPAPVRHGGGMVK